MTDALRSRIIAHTDQPDIYDPPAHTDMYARILRDAETIKAAEEMATDFMITLNNIRDAAKADPRWEGVADKLQPRLAAFRAAQEAH